MQVEFVYICNVCEKRSTDLKEIQLCESGGVSPYKFNVGDLVRLTNFPAVHGKVTYAYRVSRRRISTPTVHKNRYKVKINENTTPTYFNEDELELITKD